MQALGPGFDSQVPHILHNFVQYAFRCNSLPVVHQTPQRLCLPSGQGPQSKGQNLHIIMDASQPCHTRAGKSQQALNLLGLIAFYKPPQWGQQPLLFVFLSLISFSIFLFVLT